MTDRLEGLLREAADARAERVALAEPDVVLHRGRRVRRRRRAVPVALLVCLAGAAVTQVPLARQGTVLDVAQRDAVPDEQRLRQVLAQASPPRQVGELQHLPGAVGVWEADGRTTTGPSLTATTTDLQLSLDWQRVSPPVRDADVARAVRAGGAPPGSRVVDTGLPQDGPVRSRTYLAAGGFVVVYAWAPDGGLVSLRGSALSGPSQRDDAAQLERIARRLLV